MGDLSSQPTAAPRGSAELFARLKDLGISVTTVEHPPAFTVEGGEAHVGHLPGVHIKNLFLCDAKKQMWLVVAPWDRAIDLKRLPALIGSARLSFGSADRLRRTLGVEPGSVTPFAVMNDSAHQVRVALDMWMMTQPLINTMTTTIRTSDLRAFFAACGHRPQIIDLAQMAAS